MASSPATLTQGPLLIGITMNIFLFGIMIGQTFMYFRTYQSDRKWTKCLVAFLFVADCVNTTFNVAYLYDTLVNHFGDDAYLADLTLTLATDPATTGIITATVQLFFAWRVYVLSKNKFAIVAIILCAAANFLASLGTSIGVGFMPLFADLQKLEIVIVTWLVSAAVGDVLISASLVWHLNRRKTGITATDDVVNRIIRATVQTGLVTAVCAVVDLICYLAIANGTHLIFNVPLAKLYTNCLMSTLNSRSGWQSSDAEEEGAAVAGGRDEPSKERCLV